MRPAQTPIGLRLTRVSRSVSRAFDGALAEAGGSLAVWLVLVNLKANPRASQRELAEAIGLTQATLTHHLNAMDADGLVTRRRDPTNRRVHVLEMTDEGQAAFTRLRAAALDFDRRLRRGISSEEVGQLTDLLDRLGTNADDGGGGDKPWTGVMERRP